MPTYLLIRWELIRPLQLLEKLRRNPKTRWKNYGETSKTRWKNYDKPPKTRWKNYGEGIISIKTTIFAHKTSAKMLRRKIENALIEWKNNAKHKLSAP